MENTNTQESQESQLETTLAEIRHLIKQGMHAEGIEETVIAIGVSMFQVETVLQEILARLVATQRLLIDKEVFTELELTKSVQKTFDEQGQILEQATQSYLEENGKDV